MTGSEGDLRSGSSSELLQERVIRVAGAVVEGVTGSEGDLRSGSSSELLQERVIQHAVHLATEKIVSEQGVPQGVPQDASQGVPQGVPTAPHGTPLTPSTSPVGHELVHGGQEFVASEAKKK